MSTQIFKLPSGVECEVGELTGKHQRILTEQSKKAMGDNLNEVLVDVIKRIGTRKNIDMDFVKSLLTCDRRKILCEVRQFTMDFDPIFKFTYDYTSVKKTKESYELEIDLSENFPHKPLMVLDADGKTLVPATYSEYSEITKERTMVLPKSGKTLRWTLLDGKGEAVGFATNKDDRSSHTPLRMRNPCELRKTENDTVPIQINLDDMSIKDIEALRKEIKVVEGGVDTEISFEHPEAEFKPKNEKEVIVDVLSVLAFFFPSEAI